MAEEKAEFPRLHDSPCGIGENSRNRGKDLCRTLYAGSMAQ